jgi:hypothetical protein
VPRGTSREIAFSLHNPGAKPVEVAEVVTSCECLEVILQRTVFHPGEEVPATARVDFARDPKFRGGLLLEARGLAASGDVAAFLILLDVCVE